MKTTKTNIQFPFFATRDQARRTVKNLRSSGKVVSLKDNGKDLPRGQRWEVVITASVSVYKAVKPSKANKTKYSNKGWDIRKADTGIGGYKLYHDGVFLCHRDTKIECYQQGVKIGNQNKIETKSLNYK